MRRPAPATVAVLLLLTLAACSGSSSSSEPDSSSSPSDAESRSAPSDAESGRSPTAPESSSTPSPPSYAGELVKGWPTTTRNPAGVYSWDGTTCAGQTCILSFMHNGYGSGDVTVRIARAGGGTDLDDGWTPATVAGHDGHYRQTGPREEEWLVEIRGTTMTIQLTTRRGTRNVEQEEGHAIIDSMAAQKRDTQLGFRLVFRLRTNDWDSG